MNDRNTNIRFLFFFLASFLVVASFIITPAHAVPIGVSEIPVDGEELLPETEEPPAGEEVPPETEEPPEGEEVPPETEEPLEGEEVPPETEEPPEGEEVPPETEEPPEGEEVPPEMEEPLEGEEVPPETEEPLVGEEVPPEGEELTAEFLQSLSGWSDIDSENLSAIRTDFDLLIYFLIPLSFAVLGIFKFLSWVAQTFFYSAF